MRTNGVDQNSWVKKLDSLDGNSSERRHSCFEKCNYESGATGCELIWNNKDHGCYVHTSTYVARGSGTANHTCWVFGKCNGKL